MSEDLIWHFRQKGPVTFMGKAGGGVVRGTWLVSGDGDELEWLEGVGGSESQRRRA